MEDSGMVTEIKLEDYFNLVHRLAAPYAKFLRCRNVRDSDAYAEGLFLLVKAKAKFNHELNVKFITYAYHVVRRGLWTWWVKNKPLSNSHTIAWDLSEKPREIPAFDQEEVEMLRTYSDLFQENSPLRIIFEERLKGRRYEDIAVILKCSKQNVEQLFKRRVIPIIQEHVEETNARRISKRRLSDGNDTQRIEMP
jgi:DNA-directed RNA polymerase specialized sigma24 family protein